MNPLTYEDCKELKDAGFPQIVSFETDVHIYKDEKGIEEVRVPTLSELIAACGEDFYSLRYTPVSGMGSDNHWVAHSRSIGAIKVSPLNAVGMEGFIGSTPEQAVKNLWLALHKPDDNPRTDTAGEHPSVDSGQ